MEDLRDLGLQPLDELMTLWKISNHQLVENSTEQLNHKQVQKARKGRRLTLAMMQKVCRAMNICIWHRLTQPEKETYFEYMHRHLFNYAKGYEADWLDPNTELYPKD